MSKYFFRDSGFEAEALSANRNGDGVILTAPLNQDNIYILGVSCHNDCTFRAGGPEGIIILNVGAGNYNLPATVNAGNQDLYVQTIGQVSIIYHT